jgi:hypothetical protein
MTSRIIDLTGDSSEPENRPKTSTTIMPRPKRQPLKAVRNGALAAPKAIVSDALKKAIDTVDESHLRMWVKHYCESIEPLRTDLEKSLLVKGKDVVRYHADSDSEDAEEEEEEEEEEEDSEESENEANETAKEVKPISIADDEFTPKFVKCDNCHEEFDITVNEKGYCRWHTGELNAKLA